MPANESFHFQPIDPKIANLDRKANPSTIVYVPGKSLPVVIDISPNLLTSDTLTSLWERDRKKFINAARTLKIEGDYTFLHKIYRIQQAILRYTQSQNSSRRVHKPSERGVTAVSLHSDLLQDFPAAKALIITAMAQNLGEQAHLAHSNVTLCDEFTESVQHYPTIVFTERNVMYDPKLETLPNEFPPALMEPVRGETIGDFLSGKQFLARRVGNFYGKTIRSYQVDEPIATLAKTGLPQFSIGANSERVSVN